jgi:hypothetical protein
MRIIPKKTKVSTEFFTGVSLADILVGAEGVVLLFFVVVSNLPQKLGICGGIALVFAMLLVRIDDEPNYMFLLRIIKHFSYNRYYKKMDYEEEEEAGEEEYEEEYIDDAETYYETEYAAASENQNEDEGVA